MPDSIIISLDLDNTLFDFNYGLRQYLQDTHQVNASTALIRWPDPDDYDYTKGTKPWFETKQQMIEAIQRAGKLGYYRHMPVLPGALDAVEEILALPGTVTKVITTRPSNVNTDSYYALKQHNLHHLPIENTTDKIHSNAHIFIDDHDELAKKLLTGNYQYQSRTKQLVLLDQDYNRYLGVGLSWNQVAKAVTNKVALLQS